MDSFMNTPIAHPHSLAKNWHGLGQAAYEAFRKEADKLGISIVNLDLFPWCELALPVQACWVAAAKQLWAEHTTMRGLMHQHFRLSSDDSEGGEL